MLGRAVQTLVNTRQNAGSYQARFNASNLSSGVYLYKLEARSTDLQAGSFVQTKKMLLVK
jgi:glucuronoarabinoxylan endo-1,4-beta-xylanase